MKSFYRRKETVFKLAKELSILCGVDVGLIMYPPGNPDEPEVWCSKPGSIGALINRCGYAVPTNPPADGLRRQRGGFIDELGAEGLSKFAGVLAGKIDQVNQRINVLRGGVDVQNEYREVVDYDYDYNNDDNDLINSIGFSGEEGFCDGGLKNGGESEFEWLNKLVSFDYQGTLSTLLNY